MGSLAVVAGIFLAMIAIQILKIEKAALDATDTVEIRVSRLYDEPVH